MTDYGPPPVPGARSAEEREQDRRERQLRRAGGGDDGRPVPRPRRRPAAAPHPRWGRLAALVGIVAMVAIAAWFMLSLFQPFKGDGSGRVSVTIPKGATVGTIAQRLDERGVISSPFFFKLRARLDGKAGDFKPGTYSLKKDMSYGAVMTSLVGGTVPDVARVTIPEGKARREIAPLVRGAGIAGSYLAASKSSPGLNPRRYGAKPGASLEGFLFPSTYELKKGSTARQLVAKQLATFKQQIDGVNMAYARKKNLTTYDVLIIASMVEREAMVEKERPLIASVIYNRLKQGIPLGIDATIRFVTGNWMKPLKQSELQTSSGYNTRTHQGLPPGPIGNPGIKSIQAAAHPARTSYLFYVVKPGTCGQHAFSSTDAQFQRDVARYNNARNAKGGKSPTTCK